MRSPTMATNGSALLVSAAEPVSLALDRMRCLPAPACARRMHPEARPRHDPRRKQATSWLLQLPSRLNAPPLDRLSHLKTETTLDCNHIRSVIMTRGGRVWLPHQLVQQALGGLRVAPVLHQDVQHGHVLIHSAPEPMFLARDRQHDLLEVPLVCPRGQTTPDLVGKALPKLQRP